MPPTNAWPRRRNAVETCRRKIRHASWEDARANAVDLWSRNPRATDANPPEPYRCTHCGWYHLGH